MGSKSFDKNNLWHEVRKSFQFEDYSDKPEVAAQIEWLLKHPKFLNESFSQCRPYLFYVMEELKKREMPGELALLPMIESSYNPYSISLSGAAGLWQIMPATGSGYGLVQDWWYDGRRSIDRSTSVAMNYLQYLNEFFHGDWLLAIAAYNSGEGRVQQAQKRNAEQYGRNTDFWSLHLPTETVIYVPRLLALAALIRNPKKYDLDLGEIPNTPYFTKVDVSSQISLKTAAWLAGISFAELRRLNPAYRQKVTSPNLPHRLLIPVAVSDQFKEALANLPKENLVSWRHHIVRRGDNVAKLASLYRTSREGIKILNHLATNSVPRGAELLIPDPEPQRLDQNTRKKSHA